MSDTNNTNPTNMGQVQTQVAPVVPGVVPAAQPVAQAPVAQAVAPVTPAVPAIAPVQAPVTPAGPAPVPTTQSVVQAAPVQAPVVPAAPVQAPVVPSAQHVAQQSAIVSPGVVDQKVLSSITQEDLIVPDDDNETDSIKEAKKDVEAKANTSEEEENEDEGKRLPIVVFAIFVSLLLFASIYYFVVMTPTKVFDKAIDSILDSVTGIPNKVKDAKSKKTNFIVESKVSAGYIANANYLHGLEIKGVIGVDLDKLDMGIDLQAFPGTSEELKKAKDDLDARVYLTGGNVYANNKTMRKTQGETKVTKLLDDSSELLVVDYDRADAIIEVVERVKQEVVDEIHDNELERTITTKKIKNQTTIALLASCELDNEQISRIYYKGFGNLKDDEKFIQQVMKATGFSKSDVKEYLKDLYERKVVTESIKVNLYMNLANTQLISLDITVDNYYVKIDNLNGYFIVDIKYLGKKDEKTHEFEATMEKPQFSMSFEYDANKGNLNGTGTIYVKGQDQLYAIYRYTRREDEGKKTGNKLDIFFYKTDDIKTEADERDRNKYLSLIESTLLIEENASVQIYGPKYNGKDNLVANEGDVKDQLTHSTNKLMHVLNFILRRLLYNDMSEKDYVDKMNKMAIDRYIEKLEKDNEKNKTNEKLTINDIKAEAREAFDLCNRRGQPVMRYNGLSVLTGKMDKFPFTEEKIFDWVCMDEMKSGIKLEDSERLWENKEELEKYEQWIEEKYEEY